MIEQVTIGRYYAEDSIVHRSDGRLKLLFTLVMMLGILFVWSYVGILIFAIVLILEVIISKVPITYIFKGLIPFFTIFILASFLNVFFYEHGVERAIKVSSKMIMLIISSSMYTYTTTPSVINKSWRWLMSPLGFFGIPVEDIAMTISIGMRFIPVLSDEAIRIKKAQMARGADFENKNIKIRIKNYMSILIPIFSSAFTRAEELADAMDTRCYGMHSNKKSKGVN